MEVNNNYKNKNIEKLANMFSILGDNTRLQIVTLLMHRDANVGEIASELNMTQSAISHQLRILRDAQILKNSKIGRKVIYSINDDHVMTIINEGLKHMAH
ncbi:MAG: ArsR/SmtB family transcription factor [Bacilli bacterium]